MTLCDKGFLKPKLHKQGRRTALINRIHTRVFNDLNILGFDVVSALDLLASCDNDLDQAIACLRLAHTVTRELRSQ